MVVAIVALPGCEALAGCGGARPRQRYRPPIAQERIDETEERPAPVGVSPEDRADVLRAALDWILDDARGASAGAAKRLGEVIVMRDELRSEPPEIPNVQWNTLQIIELLVREKKHAFVYVVVSEVYRKNEVLEVAIALRQIWLDDNGDPQHAPLGAESTLLQLIRTPQGLQLVLTPTGK